MLRLTFPFNFAEPADMNLSRILILLVIFCLLSDSVHGFPRKRGERRRKKIWEEGEKYGKKEEKIKKARNSQHSNHCKDGYQWTLVKECVSRRCRNVFRCAPKNL